MPDEALSAAAVREAVTPPLSPEAAVAVAEGRARLALTRRQVEAIAAGHARLGACVAQQRLVYGVTTGFGPLADRIVPGEAIETLQRNLIYHLATGVGAELGWVEARLVALARLCSLVRGVSGASPALADKILGLLASPYAPRIPEQGTVGASGDLTPLSHLALALIGEGGFLDREGRPAAAETVRAALGGWLDLRGRDGLALVNGTSAMTGIAALNAVRAARLIGWAEALTVGAAELLGGRAEAWDPRFAALRDHPGQRAATRALAARAEGSRRLASTPAAVQRLAPGAAPRTDRPLQDAYTLRCAPQVLGTVRDQAEWHAHVVETELNAATDNPIFPEDGPPALHGGNFMGTPVAAASDLLAMGVVSLAGLAERQVARLTDERLNGGLPAFLHRGPAGLNSGLMGAQVTATALLAEMRTRAVPASIQSISTNAANQDVVSMGTIAARTCARQIEDAGRVLAILALAVAQGVDIAGDGVAPATARLVARLRAVSPPLERDRPLAPDIAAVAALIRDEAA